MKRIVKYSVYAVLLTALSLLSYVFFIAPWPGETISDKEITFGSIGQYVIGDTKEEILAKSSNNEAFSPTPKPEECLENWLYVSQLNSKQKSCLMNSNEWGAGNISSRVCNGNEDFHVTLYFFSDHLSRIRIRCTLAE